MTFTYEELRAICGTIGLVLFVAAFIAGVVWVFLPKNKKDMDKHSRIPLDEDGENK